MRIILLVVFYFVAYVARIADGRDTARTMLGNSVKHIFRQESKITQDRISEPIDDEIIQKINRQSLIVNRIDDFSQNKKNLARIERNLRREKRRAKKLSKIARHQNDDNTEENVSSNVPRLQRHPIWQVPESTIATVNLNQTTIAQVINRSSLMSTKLPSQLKNSNRSVNETILSKYPDLQKLSDKNILHKNVVFYKIADPKLGIVARPAFKKLNNEILLPVYSLSSTGISSNSNRSQEFQWRYNGYKKDISNKGDSFDYHSTRPNNKNRRFLLVPISKDLYVLKNIQDSPRIDTDRIIIADKSVKKNKNNATSAMLSFKAHPHHNVKDVGKAYHQKYFNNYHLTDHNTNYLYPDHRVFEEDTSPAENLMPPSYPNILYPAIGIQTHPNLIDVAPEISDKQIIHNVPDYENTSLMDRDINFDSEIDLLLSSSTSFEMSYYNATSYSTNVDKKIFDISQSAEEAFDFSTKKSKDNKINFMEFSTQYESTFDESTIKDNTFFSNTTYFFTNNDKNILNNRDIITDNKELIISTSSKDNEKQSTRIDAFNNKSIDEALFNDYTTRMDLFLNEDHTISDANKLKKKQFNANPHTLLMALKPLSSDLQKLLSAVELVNQSISNVQSKLCDKKNIVKSTKIKKSRKKGKTMNIAKSLNNLHHYNSNLSNNQFLSNRRIKTKSKIVANQAINDVKLKKKTKFLFLDKLSTPLYKHGSSTKSLKIQNGHRNFLIKRKLNEKKFPKLGDAERRKMSHLRFNRNLKSLTKNYEVQKVKPARQFTKLGFGKITHTTIPILTLSRLIKSNVLSKSNFLNGLSSSKNKFSSTKKDNQAYFLLNNKRNAAQHKRAMQKETNSSNIAEKLSSINPQSHREMTAYQEILGLLDMTEKPRVEHPTVVTAQNVTESLLISITTEFFITTTFLPYFIQEPSTTASTIAGQEESPEATEYEYYGEDYDTHDYTEMYEDYEDERNVTSYNYTKKTTTAMKEIIATGIVSEIIFQETTRSVVEIETSTETLIWHTTIEYPFSVSTLIEMTTVAIISEILETASVTESPSAFTVTMSTTLPLFYITESTTLSIDEATILFSEITTEKTVTISAIVIPTEITEISSVIPITEKFTTESIMLLTPLFEGMTDITLKITIPAVTKISIKETTEKETIITSTLAMELTQSLFTETSTSLYTFSTAPATVETKSTVQVTTPTVPVLKPPAITERPQTTTSIGETISVTERAITVTTIESTTALGGRTTLHEASKITYITRIETEMEDVTPFSTRTVTFATHVPTNATKMTEKITSVVKENKTTSIKEITSGTIPKELKTATTKILTTINVTTESTIKTSTITSEITTTRSVTPTIASSFTISEKTETILSTEAEVTTATEEESPVTQIEKTITAEETTAETPTSTEIPTTTEISTSIITPIITKTLATTQISTTGESTTITKIPTFIETPTITEISTVTVKTSKVPIIITIARTLMTKNLTTAKILPTETPSKALTTIKPSVTTKIPTTIEITTITRILMPLNVTTTKISTTETLTSTGTPTFTKPSATTEIPTTIETTRTLMPTNVTTIEISTIETLTPTETPTIIEFSTTTEISTTIESTITIKTLMPTNVTITEISTTEILIPTETPTIIELSTTTEISTIIETTTITRTLMPASVTTTEISTTEILTPTETPTIIEFSTTTEISTTIESTIISETLTTSKIPTITKIATITESETYIETTITTIEILTPTETTTETLKISEISTTSETPIITETTIIETLTPIKTAIPEILTIISTPTITETPIIIQTSSIAETQTIIEIPVTTESSTIMETSTITSIYITTPFSVESTVSSVITTFPTKEFTLTSITPTIFTTITSTSAFSVTPVTTISFKTTVPVIELTTTTLIANITLSETPCTMISSTFFTTTKELLTSTTEMFLTTSSILENATIFSTNISTITTEIYESTITMPSLTKIPIATPIMIDTETTSYETTPIVISTTFSTVITESTTPTSTISPLETYEASTEEETTISITTAFIKEERITDWTTIEKTITIIEMTTPMTYLSPLTRPFLESTTETTAFEMITLSTPEKITFTATSEKISPVEEVTAVTTEETLSTEEITNITFITMIEEISTAIFSTEKSTTSATETSISLVPAITISATFPEITTETMETSLITTITVVLSTTGKPEYMTTTKVAVTVTFTPFFKLPETEEFTTESPVYTTESSTTLFTEITIPLAIPTSAASTEEIPEVETEYYIAQGPEYEEYEDYDKEIPTGEWFDYEEYETTMKREILSTVKYTKPEERFTSPFSEKATTVSLYETKISKFTTHSTSAATYTSSISSTPCTYVEEVFTSTLKTSIIAESTTTSEAETESTASTASEVEKSTTGPTFGSTEEYILPSSTVFEITTKPLPLEFPTISPEYTESTESTLESSTETTRILTLPKFVTKPKEIPEIERTTTSERILTETRVTVETSIFASSVLTTLSEKEAVEVHVTITSPASWETAIETGYESTTRATTAMLITEEEYATPFIASQTEFEFITTSETVEQRDQLLQQLDHLKEHEKEMAEKEERLKEREQQWDREKEERLQMMREEEEMKNITSTIAEYITTAVTNLTLIYIVSTENLTASTSTEIEISSAPTTISSPEIITISTPFYSTEEITLVTYTAEMTEHITTEESTMETEELPVLYTTESSTYIIEELEKTHVTDYIIFTPYITTSITDLFEISISSVETTTPYSIEETYTTSYGTVYMSEPSFTSPTLLFTSATTLTSSTAISTETEYEEIERLKEELRKKEHELEERERILLEREKKLKKDILEFEKYMKEFEKEMIDRSSTKSTVSTSLSTPVPPIEKTTAKLEVTTLAITEKKENRTTKMTTSRYKTTKVEGIEEKVTIPLEEEEIVTKKICLNVLENTTIPLDKAKGIVTKKICLPYFPEKNEKKKPVGRLSRKPLAFQKTREFRQPKHLSDFRFRKKRRERASTRKISNLQLLHHEWLSNKIVKPLRHFKGFTRIYQKTRKPFLRNVAIINAQENAINNFYNITSLYERRVLDRYENFFQFTTKSTLHNEKYEKRNAFLEYNLIPASKRQKFSNNDKTLNVKKRDISTIKKNVRFLSTKNIVNISSQKATTAISKKKKLNNDEDEFYTVNVVQLNYNENEETHKVISANPDKNDLIVITTPYYELEEEADLKEEDDELSEETEKKIQEENDDIEDMIDNYMNYEERETSTLIYNTRFLDKDKNKRMTEGKAELLDQIWPTEKITSFHLGGTRFWELDFQVTESSVSSAATDKSKTSDLSVTKTTCFHVILKNERHSDSEMKRNIHHHKRNSYNNKAKKYNMEKKDTSLKNVTRKNALHNKLRIKRPDATVKELKYNLQNLRGSNHYKQNSKRKRMVKPGEFPLSVSVAGNESSIIARSRKLCSVKEKEKHEKHKDATNIKNKTKLVKSQKIISHSLKNCTDSCITNKKNSDKRHKIIIAKTTVHHNFHVKKSLIHPNVIVNHKNKYISHKRKLHDCLNCICDIMNVINDIRSILDKTSFLLDEIKELNCSKYKETQDKIVISMNSDMEEAKEFSQSHYNTEFLKGQKYIKLEELEDDFKSDLELDNDHDIISLPGLNLNLPCSQDGDGITWLSSISRPSYTWKRTDGIALFGFVAENGDLELRNVNAKDTGNYTCVITYMGPDNEEPVETTYEVHLQVVTLPRYILYGENRYHIRSCDERDMDVLVTYLPLKLNSIICEEDLCNAYVLPPSCTRNQITVNILIVPSHIVKLMTVDPKHCNVLCLKAIQDKLSLILSRNLQIFLGKTNYLITNRDWCQLLKRPQDGKEEGRVQIRVKNSAILAFFPVVQLDMVFVIRVVVCDSCVIYYMKERVPCNMGTYSEDGISHCKRCPPGTYQPNHGARVCRTCTNPLTKGCYNMLWNSFSAVMVTLASFSVMLSIFLLLLWIICCAKKKFCVKKLASIVPKEGTIEQEKHLEQPLIKDISENEDQQWDSEYRIKKKRKSFINKRRRKQNERKKYEKMHAHEDEWGSHRIKNAPIICPDSYRSHEDYNNYYPKRSYRQGPRLPECDFDT